MTPTNGGGPRLGVLFHHDEPPEKLRDFALAAEELGLDDLWLVEDLGWSGGLTSASLVLAATRRLRVGIGVMPAPLRNPALLAMELATLARVYPDRFVAGIGHGVQEWMAQVGAAAPSPMALLEETVSTLRTLLAGEEARVSGRAVRMDGVRLAQPPASPPPLVAGVVGPRSLRLAGRVADGTILPEGLGPRRIADALDHIGQGRAAAEVSRPHELIVFTHLCVPEDRDRVTSALAPQAQWLGIPTDEVFLVSGDPAAAAEGVHALARAGAATVVLRPIGPEPLTQLRSLLSALRG